MSQAIVNFNEKTFYAELNIKITSNGKSPDFIEILHIPSKMGIRGEVQGSSTFLYKKKLIEELKNKVRAHITTTVTSC